MRTLRLAACCGILGGLAGCATRAALIAPSLPAHSQAALELSDTPFHPQRALQCGPASLATVLGASGVKTTPDELEQRVFLPGREGSLQVEMLAAPRSLGRLTYPLGPNLADLLAELEAGRPALVLHNYGLPFRPRWHYAVVIGYDSARDAILLRSGKTRRQALSAHQFMRAWDNADRWAMVVLKPGELPANPNLERYLQSAAAFERTAQPAQSWRAFDAAVRQWPQEPVAWIGRGTASHGRGDLSLAADDYAAALRLDPAQAGARNNLAMTLLELDCPEAARETIDSVAVDALTGPLLDAVRDTRAQIFARGGQPSAAPCRRRPAP